MIVLFRPLILSMIAIWLVASPPAMRLEPPADATIRRDTFGVPHIVASTEAAAAEAQGYATAEDHLAELAEAFLRARGERAAYLGERWVESDLLVKHLRMYETAANRFDTLPEHMRGILNGYAAGYNRYLAAHRADAPAWAQPITGVDVLAHCRTVLLFDFALQLKPWQAAAAAAMKSSARLTPPIAEPAEDRGSNAWAVGRGRSASGRGLLLANPHLPWNGQFLFHELQITVPGTINVYGGTLIGFPVVAIGFNEHLGWTHTVNVVESDDVFELAIDPEDPNRYLWDGKSRPFEQQTVSIKVKKADGTEGIRRETLLWSHLGPVRRGDARRAYALKSANLDDVGFLTQWNAMGKARSFDEFQTSLQATALPMFNIVYADDQANVYYLFNGRVPVRMPGAERGLVRGGRSADEWTAVHPLKELPQLLNPPGGYVQNCNDPPWYTTPHLPIDPAKYPGYTSETRTSWRGQTSVRLLENDTSITLDELRTYKFDTRLMGAERTKPDLLQMIEQSKDPALTEAATILRDWDNRANVDSRGAMLFTRWWDKYVRESHQVSRVPWSAVEPYETPRGIGDPVVALDVLRAVMADLRREFGRIDPAWGDVNRFRRGDLDLPVSGAASAYGPFRVVSFNADHAGHAIAASGDSFVLAVEFSSPLRAYSVLTYSESSDTQSKHFNDQAPLFVHQDYKPVWFTDDAIGAHLERAYKIPQ